MRESKYVRSTYYHSIHHIPSFTSPTVRPRPLPHSQSVLSGSVYRLSVTRTSGSGRGGGTGGVSAGRPLAPVASAAAGARLFILAGSRRSVGSDYGRRRQYGRTGAAGS